MGKKSSTFLSIDKSIWKRLFIFLSFGFIIFAYQNCGSSKDILANKYSSPFEDNKYHIDEDTFTLSEDMGYKKAAKESGADLVVVINNPCAISMCEDDESDSVTCRLFEKSFDERLSESDQYYVDHVPPLQDAGDLYSYFESNSVDKSCIVGVTNQYFYKQNTNDTFYGQQNGYMTKIGFADSLSHFAPADMETVKVAIIDSGVGTSADFPAITVKEDMRGNESLSLDCPTVYTHANPQNFHGSFVAGVIVAQTDNNFGIAGIAPNASIYSFTTGNCEGWHHNVDIGNAILRAIVHEVDVINMSVGGRMPDDIGVRNAIVQAMNREIMIVAAAGNDALQINKTNNSYYPAAYSADYPGVITVGAIKNDDTIATFSNYGTEFVNLAAPGVSIVSTNGGANSKSGTVLSNDFGIASGTSFSAPMVTAALALTIGRLKKLQYNYDMSFIKKLVTETTTRKVAGLADKFKGGSVLDLKNLGETIDALEAEDVSRQMDVTAQLINSGGNLSVNITVTWDLVAAHPGARLGIFDTGGTCNFSAPCRMHDFELSSLNDSKTFNLSLNEIAPIVPDTRDPTFGLFVTAAIYYPVPIYDEDTGELLGHKNIYGINAQASVDIRTIDNSDGNSKLLGQVTNIRRDMQFVYVQGWTCFEGDNDTVTVELLNGSNAPIAAKYSYQYPYMVPHGSPIDTKYWPGVDSDFDMAGRVIKPYIANGIEAALDLGSSYEAGLETNPQIIKGCKTLTAAHGFEFMVPIEQAKTLAQQSFKIEARHKGQTIILKDLKGASTYKFPEVPGVDSNVTQFNLNRLENTYAISGQFCSESPAPVEVEVSYSHEDYRLALMDRLNFGENKPTCGYIHLVGVPDDQIWIYSSEASAAGPFPYRSTISFRAEWSEEFATFYDSIPVFKVNAYLHCGSGAYATAVEAMDIRKPRTGEPVDKYCGYEPFYDLGEQYNTDNRVNDEYRKTISVNSGGEDPGSSSRYWDYYDVGSPYSTFLVGYPVNLDRVVGKYIQQTFGVKTLLREKKKFETPLKGSAKILANSHLELKGTCAGGYRHDFAVTVENYKTQNARVFQTLVGYWFEATPPGSDDILPIDEAMERLPLTFRFFQDGKMIKHVITDHGSNLSEVVYPFNAAQ